MVGTNTSRGQSRDILGIHLDPSHELGSLQNPAEGHKACHQGAANNHVEVEVEVEVDLVSQFGIVYVWVLTFVANYVISLFTRNNYKF
jgi:hypothetical protein